MTCAISIPALLNAEPEKTEIRTSRSIDGNSDHTESVADWPISSSKPKHKIPRPRNSFIIYRQERSKELKGKLKPDGSVFSNLDISREIAEMWKTESEEVKEHYMDLARLEKEQHAIKYPDYKFNRRRTQDIKRRNRKPVSKT
ncbi:high mobility group box domain-containing protein [Gorgonomyces haynaldii]|nr:high mobility group box domain-containing protein [Gorgonomyces haynaldii]